MKVQRVLGVVLIILAGSASAAPAPDAKAYLHFVAKEQDTKLKDVAKNALLFRKTYPTSVFADNVLYRAGRVYFLKKQYRTAAKFFSNVVRHYPKADKSLAARYGLAICYLKLGQKNKALDLLQKLRQRYPKSQEAQQAKLMLQSM